MDRKTVSIYKAMELVDVSRRTIYNWLRDGKVEYVRTPGGSVRIFVDSVFKPKDSARRPPTTRKAAQPTPVAGKAPGDGADATGCAGTSTQSPTG